MISDCNGNTIMITSLYPNRKKFERKKRVYPVDPIVPLDENWRELRTKVMMRDGNRCVYCGKQATEVDHILTKTQCKCDKELLKIRDKMPYLRSMCKPCHLKRHGKKWSWDVVMELIEKDSLTS
jgi:hypothetical protein